jgi:hypothetical protein
MGAQKRYEPRETGALRSSAVSLETAKASVMSFRSRGAASQSALGLVREFGSDRSLSGDKDDAMRVGISLTSNHPDVEDPRQGARWMIERAAAARRASLDSRFVGDQHVSAEHADAWTASR